MMASSPHFVGSSFFFCSLPNRIGGKKGETTKKKKSLLNETERLKKTKQQANESETKQFIMHAKLEKFSTSRMIPAKFFYAARKTN